MAAWLPGLLRLAAPPHPAQPSTPLLPPHGPEKEKLRQPAWHAAPPLTCTTKVWLAEATTVLEARQPLRSSGGRVGTAPPASYMLLLLELKPAA